MSSVDDPVIDLGLAARVDETDDVTDGEPQTVTNGEMEGVAEVETQAATLGVIDAGRWERDRGSRADDGTSEAVDGGSFGG